VDDLEQRLR